MGCVSKGYRNRLSKTGSYAAVDNVRSRPGKSPGREMPFVVLAAPAKRPVHAMKAAQSVLAQEVTGEVESAAAATAVADRIYEKVKLNLCPVVGENGFTAVFGRSVKQTKRLFACLKEIDTQGTDTATIVQLCACLKEQTPVAVLEIVEAILASFIRLLDTLIGERLTWKLLRNAWPEGLPSERPEGENL